MYKLIKTLLPFSLLLIPAIAFAQANLPRHDLRVRFDLIRNTLIGDSTISISGPGNVTVNIAGLTVFSVTLNGVPLKIDPAEKEILLKSDPSGNIVHIEYEVTFRSAPGTDKSGNPGVVSGNLVNTEGISLTGGWYPSLNDLTLYSLSAILPEGLEGISEADEIMTKMMTKGDREFFFVFQHPAEKINFIAGRYNVEKANYNDIDIYAYFMPADAGLSRTYIEYTKKYLAMYEGLLGKYPFKRFSIVENMLPTGYAMPTFTLLGQDIVKLPFIVETSLGHEILHQWLGCYVYVDYKSGNWSEGLTSYLADHRYEEMKEAGADYRKQALVSYQSYVTAENDFPLTSFSSRTDRTSGAIGYSKATMVFHMLRKLVGDDNFNQAVRTFVRENAFRPASWKEIMSAFESVHKQQLDWFFKQWIVEKAAPEIEVRNLLMSYKGPKAVVSFDLLQKDKAYRLLLPVIIRTKEGDMRKSIEIDKSNNHIEIETDGSPVELVIDDNYDLFRRLADDEFPAVISRLLGNKNKILALPESDSAEAAKATGSFKKEGFAVKNIADVNYDDIKSSSLLIIGPENSLVRRLLGKVPAMDGDMYLVTRENPFNKRGVVAIIGWSAAAEGARYIQKISHYGKYSDISFKEGKNTLKTIAETNRGIKAMISGETAGIEVRKLVNLQDIIESLRSKKIVYAGEVHDRFEHHRVQFEIIRGLHKKNEKLAIGMEMFQKPFQKVLDDYIAGLIEEKEFLKRTEYFQRWSFDYNLYREILLYAREHKIPVVALNIRKEIVSKVSKEGILGLTKEELSEVPADMDLTDNEYRSRLREFFLRHQSSEGRNFDFFHQAQVLWDESMAHNLNEFMLNNPDRQMVVIAGGGHMAFGSGIPKRTHRLNNLDYSIVLSTDDIEKNVADFVLFPQPVKYAESPKLMVQFTEQGKKLSITDFPPDSISEKAGLKKGDILLSIDDEKMEGIVDVKVFLLYKKKGSSITVRVLRNRFLLGPTERTFKITL
jgi:uncharacterized iron-regulated protein